MLRCKTNVQDKGGFKMLKDKKGKTRVGNGWKALWTVLGVIGLLVVIVLIVGMFDQRTVQPGVPGAPGVPGVPSTCPSDLSFSGTIDVQNPLNRTGAQTYDTNIYFYDSDGNYVGRVTDTTSGTLTFLECGQTYTMKAESSATANAKIQSATMSGGTVLGSNGNGMKIQVTRGSGNIKLFINQHGGIQTRVFDLDANVFSRTVQSATTTYVTTNNANYSGSADSGFAVGAGGTLRVRADVQTENQHQSFNDLGTYVLLDMATTVWDKPVVKINGQTANQVSLAGDEAIAFNSYEYAYLIPEGTDFINPDSLQIELVAPALTGVHPNGDTIEMSFAPRGQYVSVTDSSVLKIGAVQDNSARSDVHTRHIINFVTASS